MCGVGDEELDDEDDEGNKSGDDAIARVRRRVARLSRRACRCSRAVGLELDVFVDVDGQPLSTHLVHSPS